MRYLFFILVFSISLKLNAQNQCGSSYELFNPPSNGHPQRIESLGNNPQIKCLQNVTDKSAFFKAIQSCRNVEIYKPDFEELDRILKEIGFSNGLDDAAFTASSLSYETISSGSKGMLGFKNKKTKRIGYVYAELVHNVPGWKVTSPTGCFVYIFTKCGNAFYPSQPCPERPSPCHNVTIDVKVKPEHIEVTSLPIQDTVINSYYVCYRGKIVTQQQQQQQQQRKSRTFSKECILLYTDTTIINNHQELAVSYDISASEIETLLVCKDTTIDLPIKLKLAQASSEHNANNHFINNDNAIYKHITKNANSIIIFAEEYVDKKTFERLKPLDKQRK